MDIPASLADQIAKLVSGSDQASEAVSQRLASLAAALGQAVPSYAGFTLALRSEGQPVTVEVRSDGVDSDVSTSMWAPLDGVVREAPALTVFATTPGALVDLAADLTYILRQGTSVVLDQHLAAFPDESRVAGVAAAAGVSQAVGVLVEAGRPPEEGLQELVRRGAASGRTVAEEARVLLAETEAGHEDPGDQ